MGRFEFPARFVVDELAEPVDVTVDVRVHALGHVLVDAARAEIGGVEARADRR